MDNVRTLDDYRKGWANDYVKCEFCNKEWVAVYHVESEKLECPNCHKMTKIIYWEE